MNAVLISIQPKWVEKIVNGQKTIEVRKTAPKQVPFKCYIYETKGKKYKCVDIEYPPITSRADLIKHANAQRKEWYEKEGTGKVIGEFICDKVFLLHPYTYDRGSADLEHRKFIQTFEGSSKENEILAATCLTQDEMFDYIGAGNYGYGWHISDLKIYDKPKELSEFYTIDESGNDCCIACVYHETPLEEMPCRTCTGERRYLYRPPQSWQYVEELEE